MAAASVLTAAAPSVRAQTDGDPEWNHFGMDARLGFNIRARYMTLGSMAAPAPATSGGNVNRTYADGFVGTDVSGNQGGLTWNWGYQNASQTPGNDTLLMHASSIGTAASSVSENPSPGFELTYLRDVVHADWGGWGFKFAFGYSRINLGDNQTQTADATVITDTYALGGIQPPLAPYSGSFNGPGPVISGTPTRATTVVPGGATLTGKRGIRAAIYDFRVGPSVDLRLAKPLTLQLGGGLAQGVADSGFSFAETTTTATGTAAASGSAHDTGYLVGAYLETDLAYRFWRSASVFAGVEFEYLGEFQQAASGRSVRLDLSRTIFVKAGLQWSF